MSFRKIKRMTRCLAVRRKLRIGNFVIRNILTVLFSSVFQSSLILANIAQIERIRNEISTTSFLSGNVIIKRR